MRRPHRADTTFVTGYWPVHGNRKRSREHYHVWLPRTLDLLAGGRLVAVTDDDEVAHWFEQAAGPRGVELTVVRRAVSDLPAHRQAQQVVDRMMTLRRGALKARYPGPREKGRKHLRRDLERTDPDTYRDVLTTWLSKPLVVAELAADRARHEPVAWIDVTAARFEQRHRHWDVRLLTPRTSRLHHFGTTMRYRGQPLPLNASFLLADGRGWRRVARHYARELRARAAEAYPHDEETVLAELHARRPGLFALIPHQFTAPGTPRPPRGRLRRR